MNTITYTARSMLRNAAKRVGVRETARRASLNPMQISRFINGTGADSADELFRIAQALGFKIKITPSAHKMGSRNVAAKRLRPKHRRYESSRQMP